MRFTFISEKGEGLGLAYHLSSEGHGVSFSVEGAKGSEVGNGIVDTKEVSEVDQTSDVFVVDQQYGQEADTLRKMGKKVLGASKWANILEDSDYCNRLIALAGWETTESTEGINMYISTWFNGLTFISTYVSLVYRRLMNGGMGPDVKYTGMVSNFNQPTRRVLEEVLKPLEPILRRTNHRGCINIHTLIKDGAMYVKGVDAQLNSPLALALFENSPASTGDILMRLFNEQSRKVFTLEPWVVGVLVSVPPFPHKPDSSQVALPGLELPALKHLWLVDAKQQSGAWQSAGAHGKLGYITARGHHVNEAALRAYRTVRKLRVDDLQYRNDIGTNINYLISQLRRNGWMRIRQSQKPSKSY